MNTENEYPTEAERTARYEAELVRRLEAGLPLTKADMKKARRLLEEKRQREA